jgi:hypothetical protein
MMMVMTLEITRRWCLNGVEWCHGGGGSDGDSFARTPLHVTSPIF